jgi:hypothetical protein
MYIYEEYPNCHKYTVYKGGEYKCNNCGVNWLTLEEQDREAFINLSEGPISQYLTHTHMSYGVLIAYIPP